MLLFGHIGLTLAAATFANRAIDSYSPYAARNRSNRLGWSQEGSSAQYTTEDRPSIPGSSWVLSLGRRIDIRVLLVGALLPDIVDKPVGRVLFDETFNNGRIFAHSLLFLLIIAVLGLYLYQRHRQMSLLVLSFGVFTHLILDQMWGQPRTLLWPLYGLTFEKSYVSNWISSIFHNIESKPGVYVPELLGFVILTWFILVLVSRRAFRSFIIHGHW